MYNKNTLKGEKMAIRFGYACINMHLQKNFKITTNRGMIKRTFKAKGIKYASELAEHNTGNILPILKWNKQNNIEVFRLHRVYYLGVLNMKLKTCLIFKK